MKPLLLYRDHPDYRYDDWLHMKFAVQIPNIVCYGPNLHLEYYQHVPLKYNPEHSLKYILQQTGCDVILIMTKSRTYSYYTPIGKYPNVDVSQNISWLPQDFYSVQIPKIVLEEDYHYEIDDEWYRYNGITLILQRHTSQVGRSQNVPSEWFPWSVDIKEFTPSNEERINKICFIGSQDKIIYPVRTMAKQILANKGYCDVYDGKEIRGDIYPFWLRKYRAYLSCGSICNIFPAKTLEIMASGGVLLTNHFTGREHLPEHFLYDDKMEDLIEQAERILKNPDKCENLAINARLAMQEKWNHEIRIQQLLKILRRYV